MQVFTVALQVCPRGFLQLLNPLRSSATCSICPKGMYCPFSPFFDDRIALPYPAHTFNPRQGSELISDCLACPEGSVCNVTGQSVPNECSVFPGTRKYCRVDRRKVCAAGSSSKTRFASARDCHNTCMQIPLKTISSTEGCTE